MKEKPEENHQQGTGIKAYLSILTDGQQVDRLSTTAEREG